MGDGARRVILDSTHERAAVTPPSLGDLDFMLLRFAQSCLLDPPVGYFKVVGVGSSGLVLSSGIYLPLLLPSWPPGAPAPHALKGRPASLWRLWRCNPLNGPPSRRRVYKMYQT